MYKCVYKIHSDPVTITMHADSSKKEEEKADQILFKVLTEGMEDLHHRYTTLCYYSYLFEV